MVPIRLSAIEANRARQVGHDIPMTDNVTAMTGETSGLGHEAGPGEPGGPAAAGDLAGSSAGSAADHASGESAGAPDAEPAAAAAAGALRFLGLADLRGAGRRGPGQGRVPDRHRREHLVAGGPARRGRPDHHRPPRGGRQPRRRCCPAPWSARTRVHEYGGLSYLPVPGPAASATLAARGRGQRRAGPPRRLREPRRPAPLPGRERGRVRPGPAGPADPGPDRPGQRDHARRRSGNGRARHRLGRIARAPRFALCRFRDLAGPERDLVRQGTPPGRKGHQGHRRRSAGRIRRDRRRRDPGPGDRLRLLRVPHAVAGRAVAGLDLLEPPAHAVGRHRTAGRAGRGRRCRARPG